MSPRQVFRNARKSVLVVSALAVMASVPALVLLGRSATMVGPTRDSRWLNVTGTVPLPDDVLRDQIIIFFDDSIAWTRSLDGQTSRPFTLKPEMPGQFRVGPNFIVFKSATLFAPNEIVQLEFHPDLQSAGGRKINPQQQRLTFTTFIFEPSQIWNMQDTPEIAAFGITFPTDVAREELEKHLSVRTDTGQDIPFQLVRPQGPQKHWRLTIEKNATWPITIAVSKGLADAGGKLTMTRDVTFTYRAPKLPPPVRVQEMRWGEYADAWEEIVVVFSAPVSAEELKKRLVITDLVNATTVPFQLTLAGTRPDNRIRLDLKNPEDVKLSVDILQGLPCAGGSPLASRFSTRLDHKGEPLRIERHWWAQPGRDTTTFFLQFNRPVRLDELRQHVEISPPLTAMRVELGAQFQINGDWKFDQIYQVKITAGLKYGKNLTLDKPLVGTAKSPKRPPYLALVPPDKYYIPRSNEMALAVESRNVDKITVTLSRMFPSNIAVALSDMYDGHGDESFNARWAEEIASTEIDLSNKSEQLVSTPLAAEELFPKNKRGVFCLKVEGDNRRRLTKIALLTNIGLLAHWQDDELVVFAHDLYSLAPLDGATVSVYSTKNQLLGKGETDDRGIAHLKDFNTARGVPHVIVVEHGNDYTFLELRSRLSESQVQFAGAAWEYDRKSYEGFLYADRNLYRPGETIHLRWIVRKNYGDVPSSVPLLITIIKPNGQKLLSQPTVLSRWGTGGLDLATQKAYATGRYEAQLFVPGGDTPIGTYSFNLEEFVPNRMKASLTLPETRWVAGKEYEIRINAQHLFGAPAADRQCHAEVLFARTGWQPEKWKEFRFGNDSPYQPSSVPCGDQSTSSSGTAVIRFTYQAPAEVTFPMTATVIGQVFELGGRSVTARADAMVFPSDICLGIAAKADPNKNGVEVRVTAINVDETPANLDKVQVTLERQAWNYYVRRYYGYSQAHWSDEFQTVETRDATLAAGQGSLVFPTTEYGYYRLKVHSPRTKQFSTLTFYYYGGRCEIYEAARPSLIKIVLDKPSYEIGDEAEARIESPFDGKGVIVLQGEEIQRMIPIAIQNNVGRARFRVTQRQFPNVWVEATVIHKVEQGRQQVYPFSSFAAANLKVHDPKREMKVAFRDLPKEIRPKTEARFEIETRNAEGDLIEAEVTLAAVDEGIHSIRGYPNPDPYGWLCRSRYPDCRFAYYYDKVAYEFAKPAPGGDEAAAEAAKRLGAVGENWIKPVALWSGAVRTGKNGRATIKMNVPEFNGQLRLAVVACSMKAVGTKVESLFVRRPYIMQTSMPRFLLPGDTAECRVVVYNHTDSPCKARVGWTFGGVFREGPGNRQLDVAAHGEANCAVSLSAGDAIGQGEIKWEAVIRGPDDREIERLEENAPLPVRAPAAYQSAYELKVLKPGESQTFRNVKFRDDDQAELKLTIGANPLLRIEKALEYVVGYPYGCVEQTTSRLLPMYLLRKAAVLAKATLPQDSTTDEYIRAGISRLFSMQIQSGALGFWPGANEPYPYGSAYALHFLTLVKNGRDFDLPEENLKALEQYVRGIAADWSNDSMSSLYQRAYAIYVLALGGDLEALQQIDRFDDIALPQTARFLLAAALAMNTKDHERIGLYLTSRPSQPYAVRERDATLISDIRNTAIELLALRQIGGKPDVVFEKANRLVGFLETRGYGTTQETAFIVTALSGYLEDMAVKLDLAAARITTATGETAIRGPEVYRRTLKGKGAECTVANTGKADLFVCLTASGVPEKPDLAPASKGVRVSRQFFTQQKVEASSTTFRQTHSYIVALNITCDEDAKNLLVADLLPAGFEIENPRLSSGGFRGGAFSGAVAPSYLEVRDDRLVLAFNALSKGHHGFYYIVNAVTPGKFQYPAVEAECMYDASVRGNSAVSAIEVKEAR